MSTFDDLNNDPAVQMARANQSACAYNAAVNYGSGRADKTMWRLIRAINHCQRVEGRFLLQRLVDKGIIESFRPCPVECEMRPGGLFHATDCENDYNHPTHSARREAAKMQLPGGSDGHDGWRAANVSLVGDLRE